MKDHLGLTKDVNRWVLAVWLLLLLFTPHYRWAAVAELLLLVLIIAGTWIQVRYQVRQRRDYLKQRNGLVRRSQQQLDEDPTRHEPEEETEPPSPGSGPDTA